MISLKELSSSRQAIIKQTQDVVTNYQQTLVRPLSPTLSIIAIAYKFTVLSVSKLFKSVAFILSSIAKLTLFITSKTSALSHHLNRKVYVWKVLSARKKWYVTKEGGFYNPKIKATIYPTWECTWNIAKTTEHNRGFESKENAQDVAFKIWMKKRRLKNRLDVREFEIKIPINLGQKIIPNKIHLRKASPKDAPELLNLMEQLGYPRGDENMKARIQAYSYGTNNHIMVAERGKTTVGFVAFVIYDLFGCEGKRCHIEELIVDTNPSALSIKRKLIEAVETFARENQGKIIDLTTSQHGQDSTQDFYKFLGYENDNASAKMYLKKEL
jgi:ribosomal protein S18 acetylase RimI-like enzyme